MPYLSDNEAQSSAPYDYIDVSARIFDSDGKPLTPAFFVSKTSYYEVATARTVLLDSGELMTAWDFGGTVAKDVFGRVWIRPSARRRPQGRPAHRHRPQGDDQRPRRGGPAEGRRRRRPAHRRCGRDRLDGGAGDDVLTGGRGNDVFVFRRGGDHDRITDFARGDRIDLQDFDLTRRQLEAATEARGDDVLIGSGAATCFGSRTPRSAESRTRCSSEPGLTPGGKRL